MRGAYYGKGCPELDARNDGTALQGRRPLCETTRATCSGCSKVVWLARCAQLLQEFLDGCTAPGSAAAEVCTVTGTPAAQAPTCFFPPFPLWNAPTSCDAMRCAALRQHARYVDARKQRVASQGAEGPLQPWSCERRRGCRAGVSRTEAVLGAGGPLCASVVLASISPQASRRACREVEAEVRASRGARDDTMAAQSLVLPADGYNDQGQLSNRPATSVKRGVPCATSTVFAHWRA
jgi:hypothetical protein